jgi:hypothetical protein
MAMSKVMELLDSDTGEMVCKVCGNIHGATAKPQSNGIYYPGSWQCVYKCKLPSKSEPHAYNGRLGRWVDASEMYLPRQTIMQLKHLPQKAKHGFLEQYHWW